MPVGLSDPGNPSTDIPFSEDPELCPVERKLWHFTIAHWKLLLLSNYNLGPYYFPQALNNHHSLPISMRSTSSDFDIQVRLWGHCVSVPALSQINAIIFLFPLWQCQDCLHLMSQWYCHNGIWECNTHSSLIGKHWRCFHILAIVNKHYSKGGTGVTLRFCFPFNPCPTVLWLHYLLLVLWELLVLFSTMAVLICIATNS